MSKLMLLVDVDTITNKNVPREDITNQYDVDAWVAAGMIGFFRADRYTATPAAGQFSLLDRITASVKELNQPTEASTTEVVPMADEGYNGDRKTIAFEQTTPLATGTGVPNQHLDNAGGLALPTTGPFAFALAFTSFNNIVDLLGGINDRAKLFLTMVNGQLRWQVNGTAMQNVVTVDLANDYFTGKTMLVIAKRRASDNKLVIAYRAQGEAVWTEVEAGTAATSAIAAAFRFGKVRSTSDASSSSFYGRLSQILIFSGAGFDGAIEDDVKAYLEQYESID